MVLIFQIHIPMHNKSTKIIIALRFQKGKFLLILPFKDKYFSPDLNLSDCDLQSYFFNNSVIER